MKILKKACPFCGRVWINLACGHDGVRGRFHSCLCNTCGAEGERFYVNKYECKTEQEAQIKALKAWNARNKKDSTSKLEYEEV